MKFLCFFCPKAGRNNLLALVKELLLKPSVPHSLVKALMKIHRTVQTNPQQRIQDVAEIISELRDPMKVRFCCGISPKNMSICTVR